LKLRHWSAANRIELENLTVYSKTDTAGNIVSSNMSHFDQRFVPRSGFRPTRRYPNHAYAYNSRVSNNSMFELPVVQPLPCFGYHKL